MRSFFSRVSCEVFCLAVRTAEQRVAHETLVTERRSRCVLVMGARALGKRNSPMLVLSRPDGMVTRFEFLAAPLFNLTTHVSSETEIITVDVDLCNIEGEAGKFSQELPLGSVLVMVTGDLVTRVTMIELRGMKVRIGIDAPDEVVVVREEANDQTGDDEDAE